MIVNGWPAGTAFAFDATTLRRPQRPDLRGRLPLQPTYAVGRRHYSRALLDHIKAQGLHPDWRLSSDSPEAQLLLALMQTVPLLFEVEHIGREQSLLLVAGSSSHAASNGASGQALFLYGFVVASDFTLRLAEQEVAALRAAPAPAPAAAGGNGSSASAAVAQVPPEQRLLLVLDLDDTLVVTKSQPLQRRGASSDATGQLLQPNVEYRGFTAAEKAAMKPDAVAEFAFSDAKHVYAVAPRAGLERLLELVASGRYRASIMTAGTQDYAERMMRVSKWRAGSRSFLGRRGGGGALAARSGR